VKPTFRFVFSLIGSSRYFRKSSNSKLAYSPISIVGVGDIVERKFQQLAKTPSEILVDGVEILKSTWFFIRKGEFLPPMDSKILAVPCIGWDGPSESTVDLVLVPVRI
jgi:hypothetical protein